MERGAEQTSEQETIAKPTTVIAACPFCGLEATWCIMSDDGKEGWVQCAVCKAAGPRATPYSLAVYHWNRRMAAL